MLGALVAGIALCWILLTPPGAGADEPGHLVRSGALARGQLDGSDIGSARFEGFDLPGTYAVPDPDVLRVPTCRAGQLRRRGLPNRTRRVTLPSSADEYPIWGHLPGGLLSRLPGPAPIWWARIGGAAIAVCARRRRAVGWSPATARSAPRPSSSPSRRWPGRSFAVVNPSAMAISGAVALWTGSAVRRCPASDVSGWLTAFGWAALALPAPRRADLGMRGARRRPRLQRADGDRVVAVAGARAASS